MHSIQCYPLFIFFNSCEIVLSATSRQASRGNARECYLKPKESRPKSHRMKRKPPSFPVKSSLTLSSMRSTDVVSLGAEQSQGREGSATGSQGARPP
jgi:hypothetical protein